MAETTKKEVGATLEVVVADQALEREIQSRRTQGLLRLSSGAALGLDGSLRVGQSNRDLHFLMAGASLPYVG